MSETLSSDAPGLEALNAGDGEDQPVAAVAEVQTVTATAAPTDDVVHVAVSAAGSADSLDPDPGIDAVIGAMPSEPMGEVVTETLPDAATGTTSDAMSDASPTTVIAQEVTAVVEPEAMGAGAMGAGDAASLPDADSMDAITPEGSDATAGADTPVFAAAVVTEVTDLETGASAASATIATDDGDVRTIDTFSAPLADVDARAAAMADTASDVVPPTSVERLVAESDAAPVAEVIAIATEPVASDEPVVVQRVVEEVIPVSASAAAMADPVVAPTAETATNASSSARFVLIALVVLVLLIAGAVAWVMLSGTNLLTALGL
jgi:hypothetical protein